MLGSFIDAPLLERNDFTINGLLNQDGSPRGIDIEQLPKLQPLRPARRYRHRNVAEPLPNNWLSNAVVGNRKFVCLRPRSEFRQPLHKIFGFSKCSGIEWRRHACGSRNAIAAYHEGQREDEQYAHLPPNARVTRRFWRVAVDAQVGISNKDKLTIVLRMIVN